MKRLIVLFGLMLLFLTACSNEEKTPPVLKDVQVENQSVEAFGLVKVLETIYISSGVSAQINDVYVTEGQKVKEKDSLALIDMSEANAQISSKRESIEILNTKIEQKQSIIDREKVYLKNGNSPELVALKRKYEYESKLYQRLLNEYAEKEELAAGGIIPEADRKNFYFQVEDKEKSVEDARLAIERYESDLKDKLQLDEGAIKLDLLDLKGLQREQEQYAKNLSGFVDENGKIISGIINGVVDSVECYPGEVISPGKKLFRILNLDTLVIETDIDEQFIKDIKLGAKAYIVPDVDRSLEYKGKVCYISAVAVQNNGETVVPVRIELEKPDNRLMPNFNVEISISVD